MAKESNDTIKAKIRAAEYVRMSTEHQQYSTDNQGDVIRDYASKRGMDIVRTYADEGKSGLSLEGRDALKQLIEDVQNGKADFQAILVYDVSRWGRFQDVDQAAFYEYICKQKGISVHYCAEMFENDDSIMSVVFKNVKRAMAGEYSRELSAKVFKGQCRLIELGYRQGGVAGYGLRRMRVDQNGNSLGVLEKGEYKGLQTDRVILVPGPVEEVEVVRSIYERFVHDKQSEFEIATHLNLHGIKSDNGRLWTRGLVHQLLINEKYIGNNVFNRTSFKLKKKRIKNSPDLWIRGNGVFEQLVDPEIFLEAQQIILERTRRISDDEMLKHITGLWRLHGRISGLLIDESEGLPSSSAYQARFGSLIRVYQIIGYTPEKDYQYVEDNRRLRKLYPEIVKEILLRIEQLGGHVSKELNSEIFMVNKEIRVGVVISRCKQIPSGAFRWYIRLEHQTNPDIIIALRMDHSNELIMDYYVLPLIDMATDCLRLAAYNGFRLDGYRHDTLDFFFSMVERVKIKGAA